MRLAVRILKAVLIACLLLSAAEQVGRSCVVEPQPRLFQDDPVRVWSLRPGVWRDQSADAMVQVNALGLRGPEPVPGQRRVLLLGDSRVYGMFLQDEQTLDRGLEKALRATCGEDVAVFNGGVPGYSTEQAMELLSEVGPVLQPEVIVLFNCMGDQRTSLTNDRTRLGSRSLRRFRRLLWDHSVLYRTATRMGRGDGKQQEVLMDEGRIFRVPPEEIPSQLERFRRLADESGARKLAIVLLPDDQAARKRIGSRHARPMAHVEALTKHGAALGPVLDLWRRWAEEERPVEKLFYETKVHPRPPAVDLLVEQLAPEIARLLCGR